MSIFTLVVVSIVLSCLYSHLLYVYTKFSTHPTFTVLIVFRCSNFNFDMWVLPKHPTGSPSDQNTNGATAGSPPRASLLSRTVVPWELPWSGRGVAVKEPPFFKATTRYNPQVGDFCHLATLERKQIWLQIFKFWRGTNPVKHWTTPSKSTSFSPVAQKKHPTTIWPGINFSPPRKNCALQQRPRGGKKSPKSHGVFGHGQRVFLINKKTKILFFRKVAFHAFAPKQCHCPICPLVTIPLRNQVTRYGYHFSTRKRKAS